MNKKEKLCVLSLKKALQSKKHIQIIAVPNGEVDTCSIQESDGTITFYIARQFHDFLFKDMPGRDMLILSIKYYTRKGYRIQKMNVAKDPDVIAEKMSELLSKAGPKDRKVSIKISNGYRDTEMKLKISEIEDFDPRGFSARFLEGLGSAA